MVLSFLSVEDKFVQEYSGLSAIKKSLVAIACAESVGPIVKYFAREASDGVFGRCLDMAWRFLLGEGEETEVLSCLSDLKNLPESSCDDSNKSDHVVMRVVGVLYYAVKSLMAGDAESYWVAGKSAIGYYEGMDFVLNAKRVFETRVFDRNNPPPPGRLESLQIDMQLMIIDYIRNKESVSRQTIDDVLRIVHGFTRSIEDVLPLYDNKRQRVLGLKANGEF